MLTEQTRIGIPDRFEIGDAAGVFRIRWKWSKLAAIPLLIFSVVSGFASEREPRFLEQRIEQRLGLADTAVAGELRR